CKNEATERGGDVKVRRILHRRLPRAVFIAARRAAVDSKKVRPPCLLCFWRWRTERGEWNAHDRVDDAGYFAHRREEIHALPGEIDLHRLADAVRRIDARIERRPERVDLDLVISDR